MFMRVGSHSAIAVAIADAVLAIAIAVAIAVAEPVAVRAVGALLDIYNPSGLCRGLHSRRVDFQGSHAFLHRSAFEFRGCANNEC
jgi:hypothetical protein